MTKAQDIILFECAMSAAQSVWRVTREQILGRGRPMTEIVPRFAVCFFMRGHCMTFEDIGNLMNKDHGSVLNGVCRFTDMLDTDQRVQASWLKFRDAALKSFSAAGGLDHDNPGVGLARRVMPVHGACRTSLRRNLFLDEGQTHEPRRRSEH